MQHLKIYMWNFTSWRTYFCHVNLCHMNTFCCYSQNRIHLGRQIEKAEYRNFQACLHNSWIEQAAAALEIELEENMFKGKWVGWDLRKGPFCIFYPNRPQSQRKPKPLLSPTISVWSFQLLYSCKRAVGPVGQLKLAVSDWSGVFFLHWLRPIRLLIL